MRKAACGARTLFTGRACKRAQGDGEEPVPQDIAEQFIIGNKQMAGCRSGPYLCIRFRE